MWTANTLRQLYITYCIVKAGIAELILSSKLKNHEIPFLCFNGKNSLLKSVQASSINPVYLNNSISLKLGCGVRQN
jgi:hypothetical protein